MRLAFLSDIHANDLALQWVHDDMQAYLGECGAERFDAIWLLGDVIGYLPWPVEVIARLQAWDGVLGPVSAVAGNHEALYWDNIPQNVQALAQAALQWMRARYADDLAAQALIEWLRAKVTSHAHAHESPLCYQTRIEHQLPVFVCHSNWYRADYDERWPYHDDYELRREDGQRRLGMRAVLRDLMAVRSEAQGDGRPTVLLCGHNHTQFAYSMNGAAEPRRIDLAESRSELVLEPSTTYLVSTGSVGLDRTPPPDRYHLWFYYTVLEIIDGEWRLKARVGGSPTQRLCDQVEHALAGADERTARYRELLLEYLGR